MSVEQQTVDTNSHVRKPNNSQIFTCEVKGLADSVCQTLVDRDRALGRRKPRHFTGSGEACVALALALTI